MKKAQKQIEREIEEIKASRISRQKQIENVVNFLSEMGKDRRIRPCDASDPDESDCPASG